MAPTKHYENFAIFGTLLVLTVGLSAAHGESVEEQLARGEALYNNYHLAEGRLEEAIAVFETVLDKHQEHYFALWKVAEMYASFGETLPMAEKQQKFALWKKGARYAERAIKVNPKGKEGHFFYVANQGTMAKHETVFTSVWKLRRIKKEIGIALKLDPDYAPALMARANFLISVPAFLGGDEKDARKLYKKVLQLDPSYVAAYFFLAELEYKNGAYDDAVHYLKQVIECRTPWHAGNYAKIILPWSKALLKKVLREKDKD